MYNILPESLSSVIAIKVTKELRSEDYATLLPFIHKLILKHGRIRILTDLRDVEHPNFWANAKALPRLLRYSRAIEKQAVVTDENWILSINTIISPLFKTKIRVFPSKDYDIAWDWVKS